MSERTLSVALLAPNTAFADIVSRTLKERAYYRFTRFTTTEALTTFMRISPVHVVVFDLEFPHTNPTGTVEVLRRNSKLAYCLFKTIVLTRAAEPFHKPILSAGVDMVIRKPVPPRNLFQAIDGLYVDNRFVGSGHAGVVRAMAKQSAPLERVGNVIPLFGAGPLTD